MGSTALPRARGRRFVGCLLVAMLAGTSGCGDKKIAPVSGRVTLDGKPVRGLGITFVPVAPAKIGVPSGGKTDDNGCFSLRMGGTYNCDGAAVGKHNVRMYTPPTPDGNAQSLLPPKYAGKSHEFTVPPEGTQQANFDLTSH